MCNNSLPAQNAQIKVGDNLQVSSANATLRHEQPVIDVDPDNPQHLIACSHMFTPDPDQEIGAVVYVSFDGGRNWEKSLQKQGQHIHPVCAFGRGGFAYVTTLGRTDCLPKACTYSTVELFRSSDGGKNWTESKGYYHAGDHPYISVDNLSETYRGAIYVSTMLGATPYDGIGENYDWSSDTTGFAIYRSTDQGTSFSAPLSAYSSRGHWMPILGGTTVMADGTYVVMFPELMKPPFERETNLERSDNDERNAWIKVAVSHDGGMTLEPASVVAITNWGLDEARSSSLQQTIAADTSSGPFRNRLYVVWAAKQLKRHRIFLSHSDNAGKTWSEPLTVDDADPDPSGGPNNFMPAVAVNNQGVVGIVWYDRRDNPDGLGWYTRFAASLDGGDTFLPSVRVSTAPMSFAGRHHATFYGLFSKDVSDWPTSAVGYSLGFAAGPEGTFHAVWEDNRTGTAQLWTAPIIVSGTVLRNGSDELSGFEDVSAKAPFHIGNSYWDWSTGLFECDLFLKNVSSELIAGPLKLRLVRVDSRLGTVREVKIGERPVEAGSLIGIPETALKPAQWSKLVHVSAKINVLFGPHDPDIEERLQRIFAIDLRVFAQATATKK